MHPLTQLLTRLRTDLRPADGKSSRRPGACRTAARLLATVLSLCALCGLCAFPPLSVEADKHREVPYDIETIRSAEDVQVMLDYATSWEGKITYASSQNNSDPQKLRRRELEDGGATDCSWFVYHVLFRYGLLDHFVHSYDWGNKPSEYPGAINIGTNMAYAMPGDLICTGKGTKPQNSHVMIYLGDGKVVECALSDTKNGVCVSKAPKKPRQIVHFLCLPGRNRALKPAQDSGRDEE